jgi:hypothetical protein
MLWEAPVPHRSTPPEQTWSSLAKRKRMAAERREQEARRMRLEADELDRKWSAYRVERDAAKQEQASR